MPSSQIMTGSATTIARPGNHCGIVTYTVSAPKGSTLPNWEVYHVTIAWGEYDNIEDVVIKRL